MWMAQQVELAAHPQSKDEQREKEGPLDENAETLRGYRILEELRTFPSVVYLERIRSSEA
jgi:molybdopterin-containing oxidoreductase family iron-sulfur binding subunit